MSKFMVITGNAGKDAGATSREAARASVLSRRRILLPLLLLALIGGLGASIPAYAQSSEAAAHKAGVVVVQGDGSVESRCVGFPEESISGYDLLVRGGFAPRSDVTAMGVSVCSVDGQGCDAGQDCFCQCKTATCRYWTFWQHLPDGWRYSNAGAATVQVHDGDLQGWVWGETKPDVASQNRPPEVAFADLCSAGAKVYGIAESSVVTTSVATTTTSAMTDSTISGTVMTDEAKTGGATTADALASASQPWLVAFVVGIPLLLAAIWWLWQRVRTVQR